MILTQVTYNWFSTDKGDFFYDYTVGQEVQSSVFSNYVNSSKVVSDIRLVQKDGQQMAKIIFEDGSFTYQGNLNSFSYNDETKNDETEK